MISLAKLINDAVRATLEKERAFASCEYDRGHFCHREIDAEFKAQEALEEGIRAIVRDEIARGAAEGHA